MPRIVVTGRDDRVTSRHKKHTERKISKLERYFDGIVSIESVLGFNGESAQAEVLISVRRGRQLVCNAKAKDLYAAVDLVLDKAETQLIRHKEKLKSHKSDMARPNRREGAVPDFSGGGEVESDEETYQDIVEKRDFSSGNG